MPQKEQDLSKKISKLGKTFAGLDIGEVDLIICYDAPKSPIRLVQRIGRTGRKREGRIIILVTKGKEEQVSWWCSVIICFGIFYFIQRHHFNSPRKFFVLFYRSFLKFVSINLIYVYLLNVCIPLWHYRCITRVSYRRNTSIRLYQMEKNWKSFSFPLMIAWCQEVGWEIAWHYFHPVCSFDYFLFCEVIWKRQITFFKYLTAG